MERRLQLLLDRQRYALVEREAASSGRSVAAVIREAIDYRFGADPDERMRAGRRLLASATRTGRPSEVESEPDWEDTKRALEDSVARSLP